MGGVHQGVENRRKTLMRKPPRGKMRFDQVPVFREDRVRGKVRLTRGSSAKGEASKWGKSTGSRKPSLAARNLRAGSPENWYGQKARKGRLRRETVCEAGRTRRPELRNSGAAADGEEGMKKARKKIWGGSWLMPGIFSSCKLLLLRGRTTPLGEMRGLYWDKV